MLVTVFVTRYTFVGFGQQHPTHHIHGVRLVPGNIYIYAKLSVVNVGCKALSKGPKPIPFARVRTAIRVSFGSDFIYSHIFCTSFQQWNGTVATVNLLSSSCLPFLSVGFGQQHTLSNLHTLSWLHLYPHTVGQKTLLCLPLHCPSLPFFSLPHTQHNLD